MASIPKRQKHMENVSVEDRISNLPNSVIIGHILSLLTTKDAVATSVLSTKWKYLWTFITSLEFDDELVNLSETPQKSHKRRKNLVEVSFIKFVYRVLARNISDLQKFRLRCTRSYDILDINVWVSAALSRNPHELDLSRTGSVPRELFACTSLVVLKLGGGWDSPLDLNVPTLVCLPSLKMLVINLVKFLDEGSIYRLFSSPPMLEYLSINWCDLTNISVLNISAHNLKSLTINCRVGADASSKYKVVLDTPNLEDLKYEDHGAEGYSMKNLDALVKADIRFRGLRGATNIFMTNYVLSDFFRGISNVQWLYLFHSSMEGLAQDDSEYNQTTSPWYQPPCVPSCLCFHLKKIEIKVFGGKSGELKMAEYFLLNSRMLEKLKIRPYYGEALEICRKLLMLPKGNKTCQVEVL